MLSVLILAPVMVLSTLLPSLLDALSMACDDAVKNTESLLCNYVINNLIVSTLVCGYDTQP